MAIVEPVDAGPERLLALALACPPNLRPVVLDSARHEAPDARLLVVAVDPFDLIEGRPSEGDRDPLARLGEALDRYAIVPREDTSDAFEPGVSTSGVPAPDVSTPGTSTPDAYGVPLGAAIGVLSYDLGRRYERLPATARLDGPEPPDASIGLYDCLLVHDYAAGRSVVVSTGLPAPEGPARDARARARADALLARLAAAPALPAERYENTGGDRPERARSIHSNFTRETYVEAVRRARELIARGDIYQVNLTQRFTADMGELTPARLFLRLRERNPAAFGAYLASPGRAVVSTSPERFLSVRGRRAEMWPIKGTRPRGATPAEDARLAAELAASEKDRAENLMIVDLVRNDLGRVAEFGSVRVDELFAVREHPTVFHLVSRVSATLRAGASPCDLLRAAFPCGSITGAPKIRAMEIVEEIEAVRRGVSMGAIGYASFDGSMDWSVAIRTVEVDGATARFNVGGGVVTDSDPEGEYEESLWKARAILEALDARE